METFEVPLRPILVFLVVLARVGGLVSFAPFWSHKAATGKVRVILAFTLAMVITPAVMPRIETPATDVASLTLVLAGELFIGFTFGLVGRLVFSGLEIAAHFISSQMGFNLAGTIDPSTQAQTAAFGTIAQMLGLLVLLGSDGHHWFLAAAVKSFSTTSAGRASISPHLLEIIVRMSADALTVGVALAAPAIIVLLVVEMALEIFGRAAPQFQTFILGFPLKIALGLWTIGASLYFMPSALRNVLGGIYTGLLKVLDTI